MTEGDGNVFKSLYAKKLIMRRKITDENNSAIAPTSKSNNERDYTTSEKIRLLIETVGMIKVRDDEGYHPVPLVQIFPYAGNNSLFYDDFVKYLRKDGMKVRNFQRFTHTDGTGWEGVCEWLAGYNVEGYRVRIHGSGLLLGDNFLAFQKDMPVELKLKISKASAKGMAESEIKESKKCIKHPEKCPYLIPDSDKKGYFTRRIKKRESYLKELENVSNLRELVELNLMFRRERQ